MKKILVVLAIIAIGLGMYSQVRSRIKNRFGVVDQLKRYGSVSYRGIDYFLIGKDSLEIRNSGNKSDSIIIPAILTIDKKPYHVTGFKNSAFEYDVNLRYFEIPGSITEVSNSCFYDCHSLTECKMSGVKVILGYAFFRTGFKRLYLHEGLEYISTYAFNSCSHLEYVELPKSLRYLGDHAFVHCRELDTIKVNFSQPIKLGHDAFDLHTPNTSSKKMTLLVPAGSKENFKNAEDSQWRYFNFVEY